MEYGYYPDSEFVEKKKKKFNVKKLIKWIIIGVIAAVYLFLMYRIITMHIYPDSATSYVWTEAGVAAYNNDKTGFKVQNQQIKSFSIMQEDGSYERVVYNDITKDGYYHISSFMYNEATKELMISLRFNKASLESLKEKYKLEQTPDAGAYVFALETTDGYDYTYSYSVTSSGKYYFCRLLFDGVELEKYDTVDLNVYYIENVSLSSPLGYLTIYDSRIPKEYYDIKDALPAAVNKNMKQSPYFIPKD